MRIMPQASVSGKAWDQFCKDIIDGAQERGLKMYFTKTLVTEHETEVTATGA